MRLPGRQSLGQWSFGTSGLARGKAICKSSRFVAGGATRSEALLREALPCLWRRTGTDPIPSRTRFCPNDGKIPRMQAAYPRSCERPHRHRTGAQFRRLRARRRLCGQIDCRTVWMSGKACSRQFRMHGRIASEKPTYWYRSLATVACSFRAEPETFKSAPQMHLRSGKSERCSSHERRPCFESPRSCG